MCTLRIGVDIGGTFIDYAVWDSSSRGVAIFKEPREGREPGAAVGQSLANWLADAGYSGADVEFFCHGTTIGTNAVLEGTGARTGLLVTEGLRGIYEVGEQTRGSGASIYDLSYRNPSKLVSAYLTEEVQERVAADGSVLRTIDVARIRERVRALREKAVESIAVCLLFSFLNDGHERAIEDLIHTEFPELDVSLSSEVVPQIREYYRMSTTVANAYLNPLLDRYLADLEDHLTRQGITTEQRYIMRSNGGMAAFDTGRRRSVETVLSGPAAGAVASQHWAARADVNNLVSFDMGGTSTDVVLLERGQLARRIGGKVHELDLLTPRVDIHTIAAGGGTLASIGPAGTLHVGPRSAGSTPGPAAYGRGGNEPTLTDARVVLGHLPADCPLAGGSLSLDHAAAARAIQRIIAEPLGVSTEVAAQGICDIVDVKMQEAIKTISSYRGHDLRDFYLFAFGGMGPLHGAVVAEGLGMRGVIVPPHPGVMSALGLLWSDVRQDLVSSALAPWETISASDLRARFLALYETVERQLKNESRDPKTCAYEYAVDMRYKGQGYEITVPVVDLPTADSQLYEIRRDFDQLHERLTGHAAPDAEIEAVSYRLSAIGRVPDMELSTRQSDGLVLSDAELSPCLAWFGGKQVETSRYRRPLVPPGVKIPGPAILQQDDATTLVAPGHYASVDPVLGHLIITWR